MTTFMKLTLHSFKTKQNAVTIWIGHKFFIAISDVEKATVVLKSTLHKNFMYTLSKELLGNGLLFAPVDIWHRRRKIIGPALAPRHVNNFVTVFEENNKILAEKLKSKVGKANFCCWDYVLRYTLDSICGTVFGVSMDLQRHQDHPFFDAFIKYLDNVAARIPQPWLHIDALYKLLPVHTKQEQKKKIIYEFIDGMLYKEQEHTGDGNGNKENTDNPEHNAKSQVKTIMNLLTDISQYTQEELREEILVLLLAATDTSAVAICNTILLLSQHGDVQEKVYREIQEVVGDSDKPLQLKDLLNLKYTKAVINESIRLYPPVPCIVRYCTEDLHIMPSDITLPRGTNAIINILGLHRNPQYWGEDVNDFNPDRFMSGQIPKAFIPFSHGPRNCVGGHYAMLSITTTLVTLLGQYRFTPAINFTYDKYNPLRFSFNITMKQVDNYPIQIEYRN